MSIQERLHLILKMHNLTPSAFADKLGVQRSNVSHLLSGRNKPSLDFLEKIITHFPRVNAHWLITGKMSSSTPVEEPEAAQPEITMENEHSGSDQKESDIEKIVEFYMNGTFREYFPKKQ
jgi:transcriptional regulator with XRE-family HTH domain